MNEEVIVTTEISHKGLISWFKTLAGDLVVVSTVYKGMGKRLNNYETGVFEATQFFGTGPELLDLDSIGYNSGFDAYKGHFDMIEKWKKETRKLCNIPDRYGGERKA